jgi:hypothetical protein
LASVFALWVSFRQPVAVAELSNEPATSQALAASPEVELAKIDQRETVPVEEPARPTEPEAAPTSEPPEPDVISFEQIGPTPPDPVELGPAVLDLQLLDAATEQPIASYVELWRIDAPETVHWTAGDQLQDQAQVPIEGWAFTSLPEGRYRVVCHAQAWGEDAAEVDVHAPRTRFNLAIAIPRAFRIRLDVRDRFGVQVPSLSLSTAGWESLDSQDAGRGERGLKSGAGVAIGMSGSRMGARRWTSPTSQPPEGFDLGVFREADRGSHRREVREYRTPDGCRLSVRIPPRRDSDLDLVVVALSTSEVEPLVRVPPGWAAQLELTIVGQAVEREASLQGAGWERAPVILRVGGPGLRTFLHTWRAADGELPGIVLEAEP